MNAKTQRSKGAKKTKTNPFCISFASLLLCAFAFSLFCASTNAADKKIVGYFANWSNDYGVKDIPVDKLTHINYAFATIKDGEITVRRDTDKIKPLTALRQTHKHIRTLISVGGWGGSAGFSDAALTKESREKFARSCARFAATYAFDGVDIDWEYPAAKGNANATTRPQDTKNFTLLLAELRRQLDELGKSYNRSYLLTIAAPAGNQTKKIELGEIHKYLDFINVMTYDYAGSWSPRTAINSPLFGKSSIDSAVKTYLAAGVPKEKIIVGVPFYGRGFAGVKDINHGFDQPHNDKSPKPTGGSANEWTWRNISANYVGKGPKRFWHDEAKSPWLFDADEGVMVTYDDPESIGLKANFVRERDLGGVMIWELSQDDANSSMLSAIHAGLDGKSP